MGGDEGMQLPALLRDTMSLDGKRETVQQERRKTIVCKSNFIDFRQSNFGFFGEKKNHTI